jgi:hypothetical protein
LTKKPSKLCECFFIKKRQAGSEICSKLAVLFDNIHLSRVRTLPVGENHEKASMVFTLNFSAEKHEKSP